LTLSIASSASSVVGTTTTKYAVSQAKIGFFAIKGAIDRIDSDKILNSLNRLG